MSSPVNEPTCQFASIVTIVFALLNGCVSAGNYDTTVERNGEQLPAGQTGDEGTEDFDSSDEATTGDGRSRVMLGNLEDRGMKKPISHVYRENREGGSPQESLEYSVVYDDDTSLQLRLPYTGLDTTYEAQDLSGGHGLILSVKGQETLESVAGMFRVTFVGEGVSIQVTDLRLSAPSRQVGLNDQYSNGEVSGELERVCRPLARQNDALRSPNGDELPRAHVRDDLWSSEFCREIE